MSEAVEFGSKLVADDYREEYPNFICTDDDARLKRVTFTSDAPDWLLEQARLEAQEGRAERDTESVSVELSESERDRISDQGGFTQQATVWSWQSAKGVFEREGLTGQFWDAIPSLVDYDDPAEGAEEYIEDARRSDMEQGTQSASGGARDDGREDVQATRKARETAAAAQSEQCDHARGHCKHGDPGACEFLRDACGLEDDEVEQLLAGDGDEEITGQAAGTLKRSWQGYKGGISDLAEALEDARDAWSNAQQAARAINRIREAHGQDPIHFERLEELHGELREWTDRAARDCHECHVGLDREANLAGDDVDVEEVPA